ncbi:MAG: serine/threonine protein kinase, partial [Acidobacteria bacterium]|nr:serine/threonine protein kinase [Acidobacteriota bacterium]
RKRRLLREARAAGRLLHPNVVTLFDTGEEGGLLFLAFEFVEGCDLASRLEAGEPPTLREVLGVARQAAEALDYAHRQGIVHRDIKPSNILIDTGGHVKVADFGIAKVAGQNTELTIAGSVMGSPQYLSPEQIRGDELDGRSDVFSLGVVLYELLSGRRPFDGETITTLVYQILHKDPAISELRAVPLRLEQLLHHMLAKDRDDRLATAGLVAEELAAIERNLPEAILAAPAAPAGATLDVTRVLSSRSLADAGPPGFLSGEVATHPAAPAAAAPLPVAAVAPAPPGAAVGTALPAAAGASAAAAGRAAMAASPSPSPMPPTPAMPAIGAVGPHSQAATAAAGPRGPVRRSSSARIWLALAALLLLFCAVVGVGAFWLWQRYARRAGQELSQLSQPSSASSASPASAPLSPSSSPLPPSPSGAVPPGATPAPPPAPAATGKPAIQVSSPSAVSSPFSADRRTPRASPSPPSPGPERHQATAPSTAAGAAGGTAVSRKTGSAPPATPAGKTPAGSAGGSSAPVRASTTAAADSGSGAAPAPSRGAKSRISITTPETASPAPAAASTGEAAAGAGGASSRSGATADRANGDRAPRAPATLADAGAGHPAGQERDAAASGLGAAPAPSADRVMRSGLELAFRVNPPDAFVLLDGAVIGRAEEWSGQKGGRSFTLPGAGTHLVKIKRAGMKDYRISVEASDARGITPVTVNLQPLPAAQIETSDLQTVRVREAIALRVQPDVDTLV